MKVFRNRAFRWILLMLGLFAIIALTGINVLSLYDLRDRMVEAEKERRIDQLGEINDTIRNQVLQPLRGLHKLELEPVEQTFRQTGQFPESFREVLTRSAKSPFFDRVYYTPDNIDPCDPEVSIFQYQVDTEKLISTSDYPRLVCDGVGLTRTKTKIQLNDFNYRWNNNWEFDSHRSLSIGLINLTESRLIGFLTFTLNADYIVDEVLPPMLTNFFGNSEETGIAVWIRDWTNNEVLATNDTSIEYNRDIRDDVIGFSNKGFLSNWSLNISFLHAPIANAYNATLVKNLAVLGVAVLFLLGALLFMFYTAQRERRLAQRQANFLANVTHELKTPLAVMQAAGENISDGRVTETKRLKQYGEHIYNESIRLRSMIEKLLDVARVDSGQNNIKPAPYRLHDLLANFLNENREYIKNKGFEIELKSSDLKATSLVDSDSFETIVSNLTENAIKYSSDTKIIEYKITSNKQHVFFSVTDHGVGIAKKDQKNIYKKFFRVDDSDSLSAKTKGHGLGLSIVKNMVQLNNGQIELKSSLGKGTTFTVRFPKLSANDFTNPISTATQDSTLT